jgi:hypothetical protein
LGSALIGLLIELEDVLARYRERREGAVSGHA